MVGAKKSCIVFLGPPGSGKGTQAGILAEEFSRPAISTGEMLRGAVQAKSEVGVRVEAVMASGTLVDDFLIADVVRDRLKADDTIGGFFLDGYPRTLAQGRDLDGILQEVNAELVCVLFVDVPEEELVARATARGRVDDGPEVIRHRLSVYREATAPLIEIYGSRGVLATIDGHRKVEQVTSSIRAALGDIAA